jgi:MFS family permease
VKVAAAMMEAPGRNRAWAMLVIAFLAQNTALGMNFAIYGTALKAIQDHYDSSRALAASGMALMTLVMGLASPLVGSMVGRFSLRSMMLVGAVLNAIGFALLTVAPSIYAMLAIYALVIGPGVALLGVIPSSTLVGRWFATGQGRALGFVNMPVFMSVFPPLTALILARFGLQAAFLLGAIVVAGLIPLLWYVVPSPADIGVKPYGAGVAAEPSTSGRPDGQQAPSAVLGAREVLRNPSFHVLWIGIGFLTAGGVMMTTHLVPLAMEKGLPLSSASLLLSAFGISASLGAILFGWLADRVGAGKALAVHAFAWIIPWTVLIVLEGALLPLLFTAASIGLMSGALVGLLSVTASAWFGTVNIGRVLGYVYFGKVPFLFGAAPLAGFLFDRTGGYGLSLAIHAGTFLCVGMLFLVHRPHMPRTE